MPFILNGFFPGHSEEVAGGKYFGLLKPNADRAPFPNAGGACVDADVRGRNPETQALRHLDSQTLRHTDTRVTCEQKMTIPRQCAGNSHLLHLASLQCLPCSG